MAPASLASSTSRDSRSASLVISAALSGLAVEHAALDDQRRVGLGEVAQALGRLDRVAVDEGDGRRARRADRRTRSTPASLAASSVRVFFTTAYVAWPRSELRSSVSCSTVRPRYSVSTAAFEPRNLSASSATAAALSAWPWAPPSVGWTAGRRPGRERPRRRRTGLGGSPGSSSTVCVSVRGLRRSPALGRTFGLLRVSDNGGLWSRDSVRDGRTHQIGLRPWRPRGDRRRQAARRRRGGPWWRCAPPGRARRPTTAQAIGQDADDRRRRRRRPRRGR